jgi:capsular polysaccharide biosynthesis protein
MTPPVSDERDVWRGDEWLRPDVTQPAREFSFLRAFFWVVPLTLAAGVLAYFFVEQQPARYQAETRVVVAASPAAQGDEYAVIDSVSALANRQFLGTYAQTIASASVLDIALTDAQIAPDDRASFEVGNAVSPESSAVDIRVLGPDAEQAARVARNVTQQSADRFEEFYPIFEIKVLDPPVAPLEPVGPQPLRTALIVSVLTIGAWLLVIIAFGTNERA